MKLAFKAISIFWILSPVLFVALRCFKVFDFRYDWAVFLGLSAVSTFVCFLNFEGK